MKRRRLVVVILVMEKCLTTGGCVTESMLALWTIFVLGIRFDKQVYVNKKNPKSRNLSLELLGNNSNGSSLLCALFLPPVLVATLCLCLFLWWWLLSSCCCVWLRKTAGTRFLFLFSNKGRRSFWVGGALLCVAATDVVDSGSVLARNLF